MRLEEHNAAAKAFKSNVLWPLRRALLWFPLDTSVSRGLPQRRRDILRRWPHLRFNYAKHPRPPHRTPLELHRHVCSVFRRRLGLARGSVYTLLDYLRDFRVWANYVDVDELLSLWGTGYRSFLDQNLATILFFLAGIGEISYLAVAGEQQFIAAAQRFYDLSSSISEGVAREFVHSPMAQRLAIYQSLGLLRGEVVLRSVADANAVNLE